MWHTDEKNHQHHLIHCKPWRSSPTRGSYVKETRGPLRSHNSTSVPVFQTVHVGKQALLPTKKTLPSEYWLIQRQQKHWQNRKQLLWLHDGQKQVTLHQYECSTNYEDDRSIATVVLPEHQHKQRKLNFNYNLLNIITLYLILHILNIT